MEKIFSKPGYASDEAIILKILAGETDLFEVLIRRYNSLLYKIARSFRLSHEDAEDLMQESHVAAFKKLRGFRMDASYKTWLTKIHLHHCYHKVNHGYLKYEQASTDLTAESEALQPVHSSARDTEKKITNRELGRLLEQSLQELPLIYRNVFLLREIEGFNVAETAALLDISTVNVKVRLNRARAMMQHQLERYYSRAEIFEFNLIYCDKIVAYVYDRIAGADNV